MTFLPSSRRTRLPVDFVVYATGYAPPDPLATLGAASRCCRRDHAGRVRVGRDYRVATADDVACGIYLQGGTEHSHGLSSSLLSNVAVRAGEVLASIQHPPADAEVDSADLRGAGTASPAQAVPGA